MKQIGAGDGVGSLWNANNWHWEEKNYTQWSKTYLSKVMEDFQITTEGLGTLTFKEPQVVGEAAVSVRKGNRIVAAEFKISCFWEGAGDLTYTGHVDIPDFTGEDSAFDVLVSGSEETPQDQQFLKIVKTEGRRYLQERLSSFVKDLLRADEVNLEHERQKRAKALETAQKAEHEKGHEKQNIAEEQRELDQQRKEKATAEQRQLDTKPRPVAPQGQGSVWNANSYHWEEKPRTQWCLSELPQRLQDAELKLLGGSGTCKLFNTVVTGEASTTIRKGSKLVIFDFRISADWTASTRDSSGKFLADAKGQLDILEFSSEDKDDYEITFVFDSTHPASERINAAMRTEGRAELKKVLRQFVADLEARE